MHIEIVFKGPSGQRAPTANEKVSKNNNTLYQFSLGRKKMEETQENTLQGEAHNEHDSVCIYISKKEMV